MTHLFRLVRLPALVLSLTSPLVFGANAMPKLAFALQDQFGRDYSEAKFANKIVVLTVADREGGQFSGAWTQAIAAALTPETRTRVQFFPVADLRGVPGFVKSFVRRKFPKEKNQSVLLDWDGQLAKRYDLASKQCNLLVFDRRGGGASQFAARETQPDQIASTAAMIERLAHAE